MSCTLMSRSLFVEICPRYALAVSPLRLRVAVL